jgi:hypothetical protein
MYLKIEIKKPNNKKDNNLKIVLLGFELTGTTAGSIIVNEGVSS